MLPFVDTSLLVYFKGTAWEMPWLCVPVPQASVGSYSPDSLHSSRRARLHLLILQTCSSLHCPTWLLTVRDCHLASIMLTWSPSVLGTSGLQHPLLLPQRTTTQELLKGAGALVWGVRPPHRLFLAPREAEAPWRCGDSQCRPHQPRTGRPSSVHSLCVLCRLPGQLWHFRLRGGLAVL